MTTYRPILREALSIAWKNKFLWFFGLFAALLGNGGELDIIFSINDTISGNGNALLQLREMFESGEGSWENVQTVFQQNMGVAVITALIVLILLVFIAWLVLTSQGALIHAAAAISKKKSGNFEASARAGQKFLKPMFILNVIYKGVIYGLLVGFVVSALAVMRSDTLSALSVVIAFIILVPLNIIFGFVVRYAMCFIVLDGKRAGEGLREGWRLFTANWLISIEMAVLLLLLNVVVGFGILLGVGIVSVPFLVLFFVFSMVGYAPLTNVILALALITLLAFAFSFAALFSAFQWTSWTILFGKLVQGKAESKLHRIAGAYSPNAAK